MICGNFIMIYICTYPLQLHVKTDKKLRFRYN